MREDRLELNDDTCELVLTTHPTGEREVELQYIERQEDQWYADGETEIAIDKDTAIEIIKMLKLAHDL